MRSSKSYTAAVRQVIQRVTRDQTVVTKDGSVRSIQPIAVSKEEGEALKGWVVREKALKTIEIGLAYGISALYMCEGLLQNADGDESKISHTVLDPFQESFGNSGLQLIGKAGLTDIVRHIDAESQLALPSLVGKEQFDFAFVDGSHKFDRVFLDLTYLGRLVKPGGIIFCDDYQLPAIKRAVSFFLKNLNWELLEVSKDDTPHQWAVLRTTKQEVKRAFDYFIDF